MKANEEAHFAGSRKGFCSWCCEEHEMVLVQRSLFSRNLYKCTKCERATHQCRLWHTAKCRGFSRVHPGWGDERCFKCSKKIDSTAKEDKKKEKAEDIGETKTLLLRRRCSWCLDETEFSLDQHNTVRKNLFSCKTCLRPGAVCSGCRHEMARAGTSFLAGSLKCLCCRKWIQRWPSSEEEKKETLKSLSMEAWCSWCYRKTDHILEHRSGVRPPLSRSSYRCMSCAKLTVRCYECSGAMARSGMFVAKRHCVACSISKKEYERIRQRCFARRSGAIEAEAVEESGTQPKATRGADDDIALDRSQDEGEASATNSDEMASTQEALDLHDDKHFAVLPPSSSFAVLRDIIEPWLHRTWAEEDIQAEWDRESDEKGKAAERGFLRPFLLLVSMEPSTRNKVACELDIVLATSPAFGDAHAEAELILFANMKGIQARCTHSYETLTPFIHDATWERALFRVALAVLNEPKARLNAAIQDTAGARSRSSWSKPKPFSFAEKRLEGIILGALSRQLNIHSPDASFQRGEQAKAIIDRVRRAGIYHEGVRDYVTSLANVAYTVQGSASVALGSSGSIVASIASPILQQIAAESAILGPSATSLAAVIASPAFAVALLGISWAFVAVEILRRVFGTSYGKAFNAIFEIVHQLVALAIMGVELPPILVESPVSREPEGGKTDGEAAETEPRTTEQNPPSKPRRAEEVTEIEPRTTETDQWESLERPEREQRQSLLEREK